MDNEKEMTCRLAFKEGQTHYFSYNAERSQATLRDGTVVEITPDRLADFLHTARMLGVEAGTFGKPPYPERGEVASEE